MTGRPEFNYPAFVTAAIRLGVKGFEVINPADEFGGDVTLERRLYMRRSMENVLKADGLAVLPGWNESAGAKLEVNMALELGLPLHTVGEWLFRLERMPAVTPTVKDWADRISASVDEHSEPRPNALAGVVLAFADRGGPGGAGDIRAGRLRDVGTGRGGTLENNAQE